MAERQVQIVNRLGIHARAAAKLVDVAKAGGANAVNEAMVDALTCKGCHDTYKKP